MQRLVSGAEGNLGTEADAEEGGHAISNGRERLQPAESEGSGSIRHDFSDQGKAHCKLAADKLCQNNGFKEGKSLDVDTTRNCSARALLSGRKPDESECRTDNYVTRALCQ